MWVQVFLCPSVAIELFVDIHLTSVRTRRLQVPPTDVLIVFTLILIIWLQEWVDSVWSLQVRHWRFKSIKVWLLNLSPPLKYASCYISLPATAYPSESHFRTVYVYSDADTPQLIWPMIPVDYADLAVIDLSKYETPKGRTQLVREVHDAMRSVGFFYVINHGFAPDQVLFFVGRHSL